MRGFCYCKRKARCLYVLIRIDDCGSGLFNRLCFHRRFGFQKNYRIYFSNLKILITSLTDYYYFITFLDKDEERVKNLVKKSKLFLK